MDFKNCQSSLVVLKVAREQNSYTDFIWETLLCQLSLRVYECCWSNYLPQLRGRHWNLSWENHMASRLPHLRSPQRTIWWFVWKVFFFSTLNPIFHYITTSKAFFSLNVELRANFPFAWERTMMDERKVSLGYLVITVKWVHDKTQSKATL